MRSTQLQAPAKANKLWGGASLVAQRHLRINIWKQRLTAFDRSMQLLKSIWQPKEFLSGNELACIGLIKNISHHRNKIADDIIRYQKADQLMAEKLRLRIESKWIALDQLMQQATANFVQYDHFSN